MQILCVDDEALVLGLTVSLCRELPQAPEVTGVQTAAAAIAWLGDHHADIALLDINLPDSDGLTLAAGIKEKSPDTAIIFLTGYTQYAVEAFRLHVSGYLLKPVNAQRLREEVEYALSAGKPKQPTSRVSVRTFGEFDLLVDNSPVTFPRARAKELLAYLVDRQGGSITRANAFAVLWEDVPYNRSMQKQLDVVIRSLRTTLESYGVGDILEMKKGSMRICPEKIDCDLYRFIEGDIDAIDAYRGEYMNAYSWASLTESYMDRLNRDKKQPLRT